MDDKELIELAAKAAGIKWIRHHCNGGLITKEIDDAVWTWNPLTDDGNALELAVNLGITVMPYPVYAKPKHSVTAKQYRINDTIRERNPTEAIEIYNDDPTAATRRAIVRSAAALMLISNIHTEQPA